jgi:chaperonin GroES
MLAFKNLRPLLNRVLVKKAAPLEKSAGGIILSAKSEEKLNIGEVVAVGPGK